MLWLTKRVYFFDSPGSVVPCIVCPVVWLKTTKSCIRLSSFPGFSSLIVGLPFLQKIQQTSVTKWYPTALRKRPSVVSNSLLGKIPKFREKIILHWGGSCAMWLGEMKKR